MKFALFSKILEDMGFDEEIVGLIYQQYKSWRREARWRYKRQFALYMNLPDTSKFVGIVKPTYAEFVYSDKRTKKWGMSVDVRVTRMRRLLVSGDFCLTTRYADKYIQVGLSVNKDDGVTEDILIKLKKNGMIKIEMYNESNGDNWCDVAIIYAIEMIYRFLKR